MQEHALTLKARCLLSRQASLDVAFLETLNEILAQKVYAAEGYSSSHKYLVERLGMSEDSVWRRTKAADLLLRFTALVRPLIETRQIHLTGLAMLHPVLTAENARAVLAEASGKSKAEIQKIVLRLAPREVPRNFVQAVSADTSRLHVNLDAETQRLLERAKDIAPDTDIEAIMKAALAAYVEQLERRRFRKATKPRSARATASVGDAVDAGADCVTDAGSATAGRAAAGSTAAGSTAAGSTAAGSTAAGSTAVGSAEAARAALSVPVRPRVEVPDDGVYVGPKGQKRYVDAGTARFVYSRDSYRCTFTSDAGHVCGSARNPQLHHRHAFAKGGPTTAANLTVYCATHNLYQGELEFGRAAA